MIEAQRVSFEYTSADQGEKLRIRDLDFTMERGEVIAILGRSGIGKSTLLRLLAGMVPPQDGRITCDGAIVQQPHAPVALVVQEYKWAVFPWKTARQNIELGRFKPSHHNNTRSINDILTLLNLTHREHDYPRNLSGGENQRVQLGRSLYMGAEFLLFDEPTSSLDNDLTIRFYELVRTITQDGTIGAAVVTHDIEESCFFADRLMVLRTEPDRQGLALHRHAGFGARAESIDEALKTQEFREILEWAHSNLFGIS